MSNCSFRALYSKGPKYPHRTKYGFCSRNFCYGLGKYLPYRYIGAVGILTLDECLRTQAERLEKCYSRRLAEQHCTNLHWVVFTESEFNLSII